MEPTEELYNKYKGYIDSVVYKYARQFPYLSEDMYLQARLIFCQACLSYDANHKSGASFSTHLMYQLKALTKFIDSEINGPTFIKAPGIHTNLVIPSWNGKSDNKDGTDEDTFYTMAMHLRNKYATELARKDDYPEDMKPYIEALDPDSKTILDDFMDGLLDTHKKSLTPANRKAKAHLNAAKIYKRLYYKKGWSLNRTRLAWAGLQHMIQFYVKDKIPCKCVKGVA